VSGAPLYRFDDLGWLQFNRLCLTLLDLDEVTWEDREFGSASLVSEGVAVPGGEVPMEAPTLVVVAWLPPTESRPGRLRRLVATELDRAPSALVASVLVLANAEMPEADVVDTPIVQLRPQRLARLIDQRAELRLRVPSVLGVRERPRCSRSGREVDR
jgi:hypothetical protein